MNNYKTFNDHISTILRSFEYIYSEINERGVFADSVS